MTLGISSPKGCLCNNLYSNNLKKISQAYKNKNDETILNKKYLYTSNINHLAEQICLLDSALFLSIEWKELACAGWMKNKTKVIQFLFKQDIESPNVVNMITQSNRLANIVISDIVYNEKLQSRLKVLIFYIKLSKKLLKLGNLNSSKIIISALLSQPIYRLTETWNQLKNKNKMYLLNHF
ncbi:hypothetical protein MXB_1490 [Myxobolus squamalis]|nr:hypothetical protein MXB_1490 [Myxobolus squamalis]